MEFFVVVNNIKNELLDLRKHSCSLGKQKLWSYLVFSGEEWDRIGNTEEKKETLQWGAVWGDKNDNLLWTRTNDGKNSTKYNKQANDQDVNEN